MIKTQGILITVCLLIIGCAIGNLDASPLPMRGAKNENDTINAVKIRELTIKEATLQKTIQEQDKKLNASYYGVSAERIEKTNLLQIVSTRKNKETK